MSAYFMDCFHAVLLQYFLKPLQNLIQPDDKKLLIKPDDIDKIFFGIQVTT